MLMRRVCQEGLSSNSRVNQQNGSPSGGLCNFPARPVSLPELRPVWLGLPKVGTVGAYAAKSANRSDTAEGVGVALGSDAEIPNQWAKMILCSTGLRPGSGDWLLRWSR